MKIRLFYFQFCKYSCEVEKGIEWKILLKWCTAEHDAEFKEHLRLQRVIAVALAGMRTVDRFYYFL